MTISAPKQRALLALLLVRANEVVSIDELIDALWGERPPVSAPKLVHVYVSQLRAALDPDRRKRDREGLILTSPPGYVLRLGPGELDRDVFEGLLERGREQLQRGDPGRAREVLREALALWRGSALADFAYESWARAEAERLAELRLVAIEERLDANLALGNHEQVIAELRALVDEHPLRERLRSRLMLAFYRCGRQAEALDAYREARLALVDGLGIEPGPELQQLEQAVLNQDEKLVLAARAAAGPSNLPTPKHRLIGRRRELAELEELLARGEVVLVSLVGPGGTGKTRLAIELARRSSEGYPDGIFFVALAAITDPDLVPAAIARVLGVAESGNEPIAEAIARFLADRRALLLLDNFEHVAEAAPLVSELAESATALTILITSRAVLRLAAERVYEVPSLALPGREGHRSLARVLESESVELLIDRARRVRPDFRVTEENAKEVASICERLDGLPLALELAAARLRVLTPTGLLARLERRLPLLTGGDRDAPARHRTLATTIAWSRDLLREADQVLFARLGAFAGGWTLDAAEAICGEGLESPVVDGLERLLDINLVRPVPDTAEPRFELLETIREFAVEHLDAAGSQAALRARHAEYYLGIAEREWPALRGSGQAQALARLDLEHANLQSAIEWACREQRSDVALRLAAFLWRHWWVRGFLGEGRRWLALALELPPPAGHDEVRATACEGAAALAWGQADAEAAEPYAEEALALFRRVGDKRGVARALNHLGLVSQERGAYERARGFFEESGALAEELGNMRGRAVAVVNLGGLALIEGDYERARDLAEQSLQLHREGESRDGEAIALLNLGYAALEQGRLDEAWQSLNKSMERFEELGFKEYLVFCLEGMAGASAARAEWVEAARLLGRAQALRDAVGASYGPFERSLHERTLAAVQEALDPAALEEAWGDGRLRQPAPTAAR